MSKNIKVNMLTFDLLIFLCSPHQTASQVYHIKAQDWNESSSSPSLVPRTYEGKEMALYTLLAHAWPPRYRRSTNGASIPVRI